MSKWAPSRTAFLVIVAGCTQVTEVSTVDLAQEVGRDVVPFVAQSVPELLR